MANDENLRNIKTLSKKERSEMGKKGGIASGAARRRKKQIRELLETFLDMGMEGTDLTRKEAMVFNMVKLVSDGKASDDDFIRAFKVVRDTLGESPVRNIQRFTVEADYKEGSAYVNQMLGVNDNQEDSE